MGKRLPHERDRDLAIVARMYLIEHMTQAQIVEQINTDPNRSYTITQQQISYDLKKLREMWRQSALIDFHEAKGEELARIDTLEIAYWKEWHQSKKMILSKEEEVVPIGNPAFLQGVERCVQMRVKLLGLDAPQLLQLVDDEFDQAAWARERDARHAAALEMLDDDGEAQ